MISVRHKLERNDWCMTGTVQRDYSRVFRNIHPKAVEATIELKKSGFWKEDVDIQDKVIAMGIWIKKMSEIYGIEAPKFYFVDNVGEYRRTGGGCYFPELNEMYVFHKPSMMTLIHEFRHAVQTKVPDLDIYKGDIEEDARAWSHSLYRKALPVSYKKALERGLFHHC